MGNVDKDLKYMYEREAKRLKARIDQLLLCENLPVTCHGLVNAAHWQDGGVLLRTAKK